MASVSGFRLIILRFLLKMQSLKTGISSRASGGQLTKANNR